MAISPTTMIMCVMGALKAIGKDSSQEDAETFLKKWVAQSFWVVGGR